MADQVVSTADNLFKDMTENDATFRTCFHLAAEAHRHLPDGDRGRKRAHSTLCALIIRRTTRSGHAGDSRLYFFRGLHCCTDS
jgi:serine/threonine protein phosphatase PrpC